MSDESFDEYGPLANLVGTWESKEGLDISPGPDRGLRKTPFRERLVLEPMGAVDNHEQSLRALRYRTMAWRLEADEDNPFHEEHGYWLWDSSGCQVIRAFLVPRGVTTMAGGTAKPDAKAFELVAELGSDTYGICSNPFLNEQFRTVRYELKVRVLDDSRFEYEEDTQLLLASHDDVFHHIDQNTLTRID